MDVKSEAYTNWYHTVVPVNLNMKISFTFDNHRSYIQSTMRSVGKTKSFALESLICIIVDPTSSDIHSSQWKWRIWSTKMADNQHFQYINS